MEQINKNAALLIIDMQQGIKHPKLGKRNNLQAEENMVSLLTSWRLTKRPVVHIRHVSRSPESVFWPGQSGIEFQDSFIPLPDEHIIEKNVPDAFVATGLERWLHVRGISHLVLVGVVTNNSVEGTARSAGNLGFKTIVVADAAFTFDQRDLNGRIWSAEDVHALSLSNIAADYASICTTAEVINGLQ
ncbi:cysteine hydrolase family protein [Glaciimonas soli]|uniref:Isochorismatase family protein n=1 Tax=Glaciimonas soli TaxID=2590999 RepID=A0A843YQZ4_9BURK|nr:cysteine hydrolase family protein [Glaciimonas soli]MQR01520.1 isochorismatase family protein [Glaciimonas soli]